MATDIEESLDLPPVVEGSEEEINLSNEAHNITEVAITKLYSGIGKVLNQEQEKLATQLAAEHPGCLVAETQNEFYDCCSDPSSGTAETSCNVFGIINIVILVCFLFAILGGFLHKSRNKMPLAPLTMAFEILTFLSIYCHYFPSVLSLIRWKH